jgi:hypothetical protein
VKPVAAVTTLLLAVAAAAAAAAAVSPPQLQLSQELLPPDSGELRPEGDSAGLSLRLQARFDCGLPDAEAGLFVSVANAAVTARDAESPQPLLLILPESQLRGVRESLNCPGTGPYLLRAQLTAFATLICRAADGTETSATVNRPVDLWVDCPEAPEPEEEPEPTEQEPESD